jgi:hypothetical protein
MEITKEKVSTDTILNFLHKSVEEKMQLNPEAWIDAAHKLIILLGDEQDKLFELQQEVAKLKLTWLDSQDKRNVSEARIRVEGTDEYKNYKKQEAKCKRIEEFVRVAKKRSDIARGL